MTFRKHRWVLSRTWPGRRKPGSLVLTNLLLSLVCSCGGLHWIILEVLSSSETLCLHDSNFFFSFFLFLICSEFCHTLKWNSLGFTCLPHPDPPSHLPLHPLPPVISKHSHFPGDRSRLEILQWSCTILCPDGRWELMDSSLAWTLTSFLWDHHLQISLEIAGQL